MLYVIIIAAMLLSTAVPSLAQEQLIVGNSYSGSIKLSSPNNGVYLALPEGQWVLAALENTRNNPINSGGYVPIVKGRFLQIDDRKHIIGIVGFESGNGSESGWVTPSFCSRKDTFFIQTEIQNRSAREKKCWGVYPDGMGFPAATASQYVRDFHQYLSTNGIQRPQSMVVVQFYRSSRDKYLIALHNFNPEVDGFPRSAMSTWQKDIVIADTKRVQYLNGRKSWGEQWLPTFEAAFNGRPISQPKATPVTAPVPNSQASMERRLEELKSLFDKKLITEEEYAEKRKDILNTGLK